MTRDKIMERLHMVGMGTLTGSSLLKATEDACREAYLYIEVLEYALTHNEEGYSNGKSIHKIGESILVGSGDDWWEGLSVVHKDEGQDQGPRAGNGRVPGPGEAHGYWADEWNVP